MRQLYPAIEPFARGYLDVGGPHRLYYEQSGNPDGIPVVCLHGGPGSGCAPWQRCFFDPQRFHIILYDQRGAGQSQPQACLQSNTTAALLADLEMLRQRLGLRRWILFGGSWGATLALLYAQSCPGAMIGLALRGVFLARQQDRAWFFGPDGVARLFPEAYGRFLEGLDADERKEPVQAYYPRLTADDPAVRRTAALAWHAWEDTVTSHTLDTGGKADEPEPDALVVRAKIACHYACHGYFLGDGGALAGIEAMDSLPGIIVHGRRDLVCPVESAITLHRAWPAAALMLLDDCGHPAAEPAMQDALISATETLVDQAGH